MDDIDIDNIWDSFLEDGEIDDLNLMDKNNGVNDKTSIPKGNNLYISTKTKIGYLSSKINLTDTFWEIPIIDYHIPIEGVIKKQMKFNFIDKQQVLNVESILKDKKNVDQHIISQIINPDGRIKFRDIRKISIGLSNKDILSYRSKKKSAFYNCFVILIRIKLDNKFKEIHVKVFNTGKLEIPGVRCDKVLIKVLDILVKLLKPITNILDLSYDINKCETVLINSNFNCGFFINRDKLFDILKYKYKINCIFDSCQYPGIQCKYIHGDYKISFMIFRTGSILIVGKCDDIVLNIVYNYIKELLYNEYVNISVQNTEQQIEQNKLILKNKNKNKNSKKKFIKITNTN